MKQHLSPEMIRAFLEALEKSKGKQTLLVDMDGVVADFEKSANEFAAQMGITTKEFSDQKLYRNIKEFYLNLEVIDGAQEAIKELNEKFDLIFVSAPSWGNIHCFTEKRIWIEKHFGELATKKMDLSFHKGHYFGHYLIDDRFKYGVSDFIGEHLQFGTKPYENWADITRYLNWQLTGK